MVNIITDEPEPPTVTEPTGISRAECEYTNESQRFLLEQPRVFHRQYAPFYSYRIAELRPQLERGAADRWGADVARVGLSEMVVGQRCYLVGTLYKHMELKPSILREVSEEHNLMPLPERDRFASVADQLIIEDEVQRAVLSGLPVGEFVTGVVMAVLGYEDSHGHFQVEDVCYPSLPEQIPLRRLSETNYYVLVASGLGLGDPKENLLAVQLLIDYVSGVLGQVDQCKNIVRVILAGNCLSPATLDRDYMHKAKYLTRKRAALSVEATRTLDGLLEQLVSCCPVDIMPGEFDAANHLLPQQPLHSCMFPRSAMYKTFNNVTNPYACEVNGVQILATSGQNILDVYKFSKLDDWLQIMELTLRWGHLAPTAPDTLGAYPYVKEDPFILRETPHLYLVGGSPGFQTSVVEGPSSRRVRMVAVPKFSSSGVCVLVNLNTLECEPMQFAASSFQGEVDDVALDIENSLMDATGAIGGSPDKKDGRVCDNTPDLIGDSV